MGMLLFGGVSLDRLSGSIIVGDASLDKESSCLGGWGLLMSMLLRTDGWRIPWAVEPTLTVTLNAP